jgi:hypothetical protein
MAVDDRLRLLHGPYQAPALRVGDRTTCLFKGAEVFVANWSGAPIPWPRCLRGGGGGQPSLLVNHELARAIRTEAAAAVGYWWGVGSSLVCRWRKALDVRLMDNPGSRRLMLASLTTAGGSLPWTEAEEDLLRNHSPKDAARLTGRSPDAVRKRRKLLGLSPGRGGPVPRS